jgi:hypothetical protein
MSDITTLKGMILGMENMGAKFVKTDGFDVYFDIAKGSDIDDDEKLKRAKQAFTKMFGLGLKVRRLNAV